MAAVDPPSLCPGRGALEDQIPEFSICEDGGVELFALRRCVDGLRVGCRDIGKAREWWEHGVSFVAAGVAEEFPARLNISLLAVFLGANV